MTLVQAINKKISIITNGKVTLRFVSGKRDNYFINVNTKKEYIWEFEELMDDWKKVENVKILK